MYRYRYIYIYIYLGLDQLSALWLVHPRQKGDREPHVSVQSAEPFDWGLRLEKLRGAFPGPLSHRTSSYIVYTLWGLVGRTPWSGPWGVLIPGWYACLCMLVGDVCTCLYMREKHVCAPCGMYIDIYISGTSMCKKYVYIHIYISIHVLALSGFHCCPAKRNPHLVSTPVRGVIRIHGICTNVFIHKCTCIHKPI